MRITKHYLALTGYCSIHNLFKWEAAAVLVTFSHFTWKCQLNQRIWEWETEREPSFRSYTNCKRYKWFASSFTVQSFSTAAHNWKSWHCQYCAQTNTQVGMCTLETQTIHRGAMVNFKWWYELGLVNTCHMCTSNNQWNGLAMNQKYLFK